MNLTNFLKQTDALASQYSAEQLADFIHGIGRVCPEHRRENFLEMLKSVGSKAGKTPDKTTEKDMGFDEMYSRVRENLKSIDSQELAITGILNEEYDDWYDSSSEEFFYQDNDGISKMLEEACDFVHICMDTERYEEGFQVGNQMLTMEILCENEYGGEEFSLRDMVDYELFNRDLKRMILDSMYCAYHAVPSARRPETLYGMIVNAREDAVTLEKIMQHGDEELSGFEEFLPSWVTYLGEKTGYDADRLILEAVDLLNDISLEMQYAETYADIHPGLYLKILENGKSLTAEDMVSIGIKALKRIPKKYVMRSRVALKTAEYVIVADRERSLLEACYFAAYESDTSAQNYLRALLNGCGNGRKREELQKLLRAFLKDKNAGSYPLYEGDRFRYGSGTCSERELNKPDNNMVWLLRFLDGQFAEVLDQGLNEPQALGWTGTFMKQGIALYLLYLYEGQWDGKGIAAMAEMVKNEMRFSAEEYRKGTCGLEGISENDLFCQLFLQWKSMVQMESGVRERAIKRITSLLEKRTAGIMDANRRNYYGECAAYIAALGEVRESMGELGAKQKLMTSYKDAYPRRSAFREAMRTYGWIDSKRK